MKRLSIVVGSGGTGSYLVPSLLSYFKGISTRLNDENHILLIDGDIVEEKNLLRQGFLTSSLNQSKSEAIYNMYKDGYPDFNLYYEDKFLLFADELVNYVKKHIDDLDEVLLFSCVDNNFARLRMLVGQQLIKQEFPDLSVTFVDSGNEEWHGQSIVSHLPSGTLPVINMLKGKLTLVEENYCDTVDNIFVRMNDWENHLDKGEHELSCDIVAVSHPQNIGTNMVAATAMVSVLDKVLKQDDIKNIQFNASKNTIKAYDLADKDSYLKVMREITAFSNDSDAMLSKLYLAMQKKYIEPEVTEPVTDEQESETIDLKSLFTDFFDSERAEETEIKLENDKHKDISKLLDDLIVDVPEIDVELEDFVLETVPEINIPETEREDLLQKSISETLQELYDI